MQRIRMKIYKCGVPYTKIQLSNFYAFLHASRASSQFIMKTMSSSAEEQQATQLIDAKRKFMQLMMRKPLYCC